MIDEFSERTGIECECQKSKVVNVMSGKICKDEGLLYFNTADVMENLTNKEI